MPLLCLVLLCLLTVPAQVDAAQTQPQRPLELRGTVRPVLPRAVVALSSVGGAYRKQKFLGFSGRFKFKKLEPGSYHVVVFHPGWGEVRRTVDVTRSFADKKGRVEVIIPLRLTRGQRERMLLERNTVSVRELSVSPKAWAEYRKAREKRAKNKTAEAVAHLEKAVEISPQFEMAWNELGTIAYGRGRYIQAEQFFRKALELDAESFSPVVNLGAALLSQRRLQEALNFNQYALALRPDDPLANSQLGMNYFYLQRYPEALAHLARVTQIDPSHFSLPHIVVAETYARLGQLQKAVEELREFLRYHPDSALADRVRRQLERLESAVREKVAARDPAPPIGAAEGP